MPAPAGRPSVVVTGMGAITSLGPTLATTWNAIVQGQCGIGPISRFVTDGYPAHVGAEVRETGVGADRRVTWRTGTQCFFSAARDAVAMSQLPPAMLGRAACVAGLSVNYVHHGLLREVWRHHAASGDVDAAIEHVLASEGRHAPRRDGAWQLAQAAEAIGAGGPQALIDTACASSLHALAEAVRWVRLGIVDAAIVGGGARS